MRYFQCPRCAATYTVPDAGHGHGGMMWAVCACAGHPYQMMTEVAPPPPRIVLRIVRTELS